MTDRNDNVTLRKDFIKQWVHANPRITRKGASNLYDALCKRFPELTRGGHRGMVGRERPWETLEHTCPNCKHKVRGMQNIKEAFGLRRQNGKLYFQSWCPSCRPVKGKGNGNVRINPSNTKKFWTNGAEEGQLRLL